MQWACNSAVFGEYSRHDGLVQVTAQISPWDSNSLYKTNVFGAGTQVLAAGAVRQPSARRGWGFPVPDTTSSSQLQWTHQRHLACVRKGKMLPGNWEKWEKCERNCLADTKARAKRRAGGAPGEISFRHGGLHWSRYPPVAPRGPQTSAGGCALKKAVVHVQSTSEQVAVRNWGLWRGADAGADFLTGLLTPWGAHGGAVCSFCHGRDPI